ncbi:hypothetical protein OAZ06_03560 [Synechococcus sp. AH-736-G20]|nr:hypothetical protein [Synechococcus sp. AH-736-G20]
MSASPVRGSPTGCWMDGHCYTVVGCALQEAQLQRGRHLTHCCRNWKAVHHMEAGPAVAA